MFSRIEVIAFVFSMMDKDNDNILSQVDMLKFTSLYRGGLMDEKAFIKLFPINASLRVQQYQFKRGD